MYDGDACPNWRDWNLAHHWDSATQAFVPRQQRDHNWQQIGDNLRFHCDPAPVEAARVPSPISTKNAGSDGRDFQYKLCVWFSMQTIFVVFNAHYVCGFSKRNIDQIAGQYAQNQGNQF